MDIVRQLLAVGFVFALLWVALWLLRRKGAISIGRMKSRGERGLLESRGKLALSGQHVVHVVRAGDRDLILAVYPTGVTLLGELGASSATSPSSPYRPDSK